MTGVQTCALPISIVVLPSRNPKAPSRCSPSPRSCPPTKRRKTTMASIFLDLSADEEDEDEDEEDEEDVARSNIAPPVLPAGRAHFSDHVQHLIARYEERHSSTALTSVVPLESHHIPLPEAQETRLYLVEFLTSKSGSIFSWILNFIHPFQRISRTFAAQSLRIAGYNVIWSQAFHTKCTSKQQVPCRSRTLARRHTRRRFEVSGAFLTTTAHPPILFNPRSAHDRGLGYCGAYTGTILHTYYPARPILARFLLYPAVVHTTKSTKTT